MDERYLLFAIAGLVIGYLLCSHDVARRTPAASEQRPIGFGVDP